MSRQQTLLNIERTKSKLNLLNPTKLGPPTVKGRISDDDRRRRVSSIFGADAAVLANQQRLARMLSVDFVVYRVPKTAIVNHGPHCILFCIYFNAPRRIL